MLPAGHRLTRSADFALTIRAGARAGRARLVTHLRLGQPGPALAGFVVGRGVGNAVVRNRVKRRLRHLVRARMGMLPPGARLVVRALPAAASASSAELDADLVGAFRTALKAVSRAAPEPAATKAGPPEPHTGPTRGGSR